MTKFTKFIVATVAALAIFAGMHATASAAYMQTTTLQYKSTGSQVMALQQTLNMTSCKVATSGAGSPGMESSYFGSETKAAVQCFQAANGLTADGIVGPMTGAKLAAVTGSMTVSTGLPAGCSSTTGYSTISGAPCSGTPSTTVYPTGCVSSTGYSSTTGVSCSTGMTSTGVSTTGPLSINQVTAGSGYSNTNVGVGATNTQVADLRIVTGAGGSGNLTGLNVTFANTGSGDFQFTKYASAVSVWFNGVQVGSLPVTSFTEYNSAYSAYIPLSGAMLNPSTTSDLYIAVSALPVIDSANLTSTANNYDISGVSLRYSDSTGSAFQFSVPSTGVTINGTTYASGLGNTNFTFNTAASAGNIKLDVVKDVNDSTNHTVQVSASSNTQNVTLATVDFDPQNSAVTVSRIPVTIAVMGNGQSPSVTNIDQVLSTLRLYNSSGVQLDSEPVLGSTTACNSGSFPGSSLASTSGAICETVTFQNFNTGTTTNGVSGMTLAAGSTNVFTIKGDVNTLNSTNYPGGTYAVAELTPANVLAIQAYDANDNLITGSTYLVGSTTGSQVALYVNGINVSATGSATNTYSNPGGSQSHGIFTMTIPFSVTSYGTTSYVPSATSLDTTGTVNNPTATAGNYVQFAVDNGSTLQSGATATITYTGNDSLTPDTNGDYQVPVGQTKTFNLVITYTPSTSGSYRGQLVNVNNTQTSGSAYVTYTSGLNTNQFRTAYVAGQ
jgi:peptidoglycan hydrolase-like protein with peptidoglycan-binding domain